MMNGQTASNMHVKTKNKTKENVFNGTPMTEDLLWSMPQIAQQSLQRELRTPVEHQMKSLETLTSVWSQ